MLDIFLWLAVVVLLIPLAVLFVETWAALVPVKKAPTAPASHPPCAVLVPAHDEAAGLARTLYAILPQLAPGDRLVVVADNCTDETADVARSCGATVLERIDSTRRGKGFALDHGVRWLEQSPPDVVVIVDADCLVEEGTLTRLVEAAAATGRPVQAAYFIEPPPRPRHQDQVSAFAVQYKNVVRPLGLRRLGLPCLLTGTGMAFPWPLLRDAALAHDNIVEDMQLGIDLAATGWPPRFCPEARVYGVLPSVPKGSADQRTRWEHGHLRTLLGQAPRLVKAAFRQRRLDLLALALELSVPPLSLLFLLWVATLAGLVGGWWAGGSALPAVVLAAGGCAVVLSILAAWAHFGRERLPLRSLLAAPLYILWKVPIYVAFLLRPQRAWIRTERGPPPPIAPA
jgi:cellulose synthase/poly-beta-1,6-N-acetylglucosamine synthase-like glycosyltransferase